MAAFAVAAAAMVVAFLGLGSAGCRPDGYNEGCVPGSAAYAVVVGALCWVGAGVALCRVSSKRARATEQLHFEGGQAEREHEREHGGAAAAAASHSPVDDETGSAAVEIETVTNDEGTVSQTRTTTITNYDTDGGKVIERTVKRGL